MMIKMNY